jgi:hypothetical protein
MLNTNSLVPISLIIHQIFILKLLADSKMFSRFFLLWLSVNLFDRTRCLDLSQWDEFNASIESHLETAAPFSSPCFSNYDGISSQVDDLACARIQSNYTSTNFRAKFYSGFMNNQDEMCLNSPLDQCLLNPLDPTDSLAFTNVSCNQGSVSKRYIDVKSVDDISSAFVFAKRYNQTLSIKNSGHDYLGRNSRKGSLGLWMKNFGAHISRDREFVPQGCSGFDTRDTITTDASVNFDEVYQFADAEGVTFIGAYASTVGTSGGWVQGGGHSVLSPVYGLGIDRVLEYQILTPDGILRIANECTNPDLFWALRGGGGGTFGVVISATHAVEPQMSLSVASISYTRTPTNFNTWFEILINYSLAWANNGWGGHYTVNNIISVTPLLNLSSAMISMEAAASFALANNGTVVIETLPSWYAFYTKYVVPNVAAVGLPRVLNSRLMPSSIFQTDSGRAKLLAFLKRIINVGLTPYIPATTPFLYPWDPESTSATPAWRDSVWHMSFAADLKYNSTFSERVAFVKMLDTMLEEANELAPDSGSYFNEASPWTKYWQKDWWGNNYQRLLEIKAKYDPDHLLRCWKCVGFEEENSGLEFPCFSGLDSV